jgi:hypothetical protein
MWSYQLHFSLNKPASLASEVDPIVWSCRWFNSQEVLRRRNPFNIREPERDKNDSGSEYLEHCEAGCCGEVEMTNAVYAAAAANNQRTELEVAVVAA